MEYVAVFYTHWGAIRFHKELQQDSIKAQTIPVPRKLTSNCGIGVRFEFDGQIVDLINEDVEKIFISKDRDYQLIYEE